MEISRHDIDLEKEDISQIVYEVVNRKAASQENKEKRAPKPRTKNAQKRKKLTSDYLKWVILVQRCGINGEYSA